MFRPLLRAIAGRVASQVDSALVCTWHRWRRWHHVASVMSHIVSAPNAPRCTAKWCNVCLEGKDGKGVLHSLFSKKGRPIHIFKLTLGASDSLLNVSIHLLNFGELFLEPRHRQLIVESVMITNDYRITPETWTDMNWFDFRYVQYCSMISSTHMTSRSSSDWSDLILLFDQFDLIFMAWCISLARRSCRDRRPLRMFWTHFVPIFARVSSV